MIDGVEVLTSEMIRVSAEPDALIIVGILFAIFAVALFYTFITCLTEKVGWTLTLISVLGAILMGVVAVKLFSGVFFPTYEERYMVQLKEEVPLDFIKNYEILEDKGNDIYIVREKGNE